LLFNHVSLVDPISVLFIYLTFLERIHKKLCKWYTDKEQSLSAISLSLISICDTFHPVMRDTIRDSTFGHLVHLVSRGRLLGWEEDRDSNVLTRYVSTASASAGPQPNSSDAPAPLPSQDASQVTLPPDPDLEKPVDEAEKGRDVELIDWLPDDPANPQNWSMGKLFFVTGEICLLTTSVYIGSAIYTAGLQGVVEQFHVSEVAALLGLTLFVVGYGVGPMLWVSSNFVVR
jgi:MFS transporter, DHA1 family, multidrug resistance protein